MRAVVINEQDNVAVVVQNTPKGATVVTGKEELVANDDMVQGHKIARNDIKKGEYIIKYHKPIGEASADIKKGDWVHTHNVKDVTEQLCDEFAKKYRAEAQAAMGGQR